MTITAITVISSVDDANLFNRSLQSYAPYVDEIIVGDNGLTSEHREIIQKNTPAAKIVPTNNATYVELVRESLNKLASSEFILVIDPDETITGGLIDELKTHGQSYDYVRVPRKNIIFKKWIEHSRWWPDYQIRFFRKGYVTWEKKLHSVPLTKGAGFDLPASEENAITHYNYESIDHYLSKMIRYAHAEAEERMNRQDYSLLSAIRQGLDEFTGRFYFAKGYKDGLHGFILSFLQMFYAFLVYFYWWEGKKYVDEKADTRIAPLDFFNNGLRDVLFWSQKKNLLQDKMSYIR